MTVAFEEDRHLVHIEGGNQANAQLRAASLSILVSSCIYVAKNSLLPSLSSFGRRKLLL
jgi:hypothetical protein